MAITEKEGIFTYVNSSGDEIRMFPDVKTDTSLTVSNKPADSKATGDRIRSLESSIRSFENTKSEIVGSGLGTALGMSTSTVWSTIVSKIKAVTNRGALNWSGSNTTHSVPSGYYSGGTLDSRPSYNSGYDAGVTAADGRTNTSSVNYKSGYNAGVTAADGRSNPTSVNYQAGYTDGQKNIRDTCVVFEKGVSIVIYGTGVNTSINPGWSGTASSHVEGNSSGGGTITSQTSVDLTSVKSIYAQVSINNSNGCGSYNEYKNCGSTAGKARIHIYNSTNSTLIKSSSLVENSVTLDASTVTGFCYIRVEHQNQHWNRGWGEVSIAKVSLNC